MATKGGNVTHLANNKQTDTSYNHNYSDNNNNYIR